MAAWKNHITEAAERQLQKYGKVTSARNDFRKHQPEAHSRYVLGIGDKDSQERGIRAAKAAVTDLRRAAQEKRGQP